MGDPREELTVGEVASLVGVSVRTLHHWDQVGLVRPDGRTAGGYRVYAAGDVARIHRVLIYRELGLSLTGIAAVLDDPSVDENEQLRRQRGLLDERIGRLQRMADAIDELLRSRAAGEMLTTRQQVEIFGRGWREDWTTEAQERWGDSEAWAQFTHNAAAASAAEREQMQVEGEALYRELAEAKHSGVPPGSDQANELAQQHRALIGLLFECTPSMQVLLGRIYASDERFVAYFDAFAPGLARWLAEVIDESARALGIDPERAVWE